jgi:hypothetical protein
VVGSVLLLIHVIYFFFGTSTVLSIFTLSYVILLNYVVSLITSFDDLIIIVFMDLYSLFVLTLTHFAFVACLVPAVRYMSLSEGV